MSIYRPALRNKSSDDVAPVRPWQRALIFNLSMSSRSSVQAPVAIVGYADECSLSAELQWASVRSEELAAALPLPALSRPGSRSLLHHLPALPSLEPGSFPVPAPCEHVGCKSEKPGESLGVNMSVRPRLQSHIQSSHNAASLLPAFLSSSHHLSTSFHPVPPPVTCL